VVNISSIGVLTSAPRFSAYVKEAADMIAEACINKPVRIAARLGIAGQVPHALLPRVAQIAMNTSFRMFPDSSAAKGGEGRQADAVARGDCDAADDVREPLLAVGPHKIA
jgi:hypothetical protein